MQDVFDRAAKTMACDVIRGAAGTAGVVGVLNAWNGGAVWGPLLGSSLGYLAYSAGCQEETWLPDDTMPDLGDGCWQLNEGGGGKIMFEPCNNTSDPLSYCSFAGDTNVNQIISVTGASVPNNPNTEFTITYKLTTGQVKTASRTLTPDKTFYIQPFGDATCADDGNKPPPPSIDVPPKDYTDPETGCELTVNFEGFVQLTRDGQQFPVYQIQSKADGTTRTDGGRIGGCNFAPHIYVDTGGPDGPVPPVPPIPVPPIVPGPGDDGVPWWLPAVISGAVAAGLNQIGNEIAKLSEPRFLPGSFTMVAPCDKTEEGTPEFRTWEFAAGTFEQRMNAHQVALMEMLQQHLNWKTPTCDRERPQLEGEWVTTRWESLEKMVHSGKRLRKLFRYRTKSTRDLGQLSAYWQDFTWRAGDVCVIHKDAWWGSPQVWAQTAEEGKRVIRFAAGEAGLDPDQTGQWKIGGSRSPRYGMSGTMMIQQYKGYPWVASRDGEAWPNTLAKTGDP